MVAATSGFFVVPLLVRCGEVDHMVINYSSTQMRLKSWITTFAKKSSKHVLYTNKQTLYGLVERKLPAEIELIGPQMQ